MGQYAFLINKENKIRCESHKISGGGEYCEAIENPEMLGKFLEYCRDNKLQLECVSEHWFDNNEEYKDFE